MFIVYCMSLRFSCPVAPAFGRPLGASNPGAASLLVSETPERPRQVAEAARWTPFQGEAAWRRPPGEDHIQRPEEPRGPTEGISRRPSEAGPRGLSVEARREEAEGRGREEERGAGGIGQEREAAAALQELKYLRPRQADIQATTQTGQTTERQISNHTDRSKTSYR
jgi:hypothetical protein